MFTVRGRYKISKRVFGINFAEVGAKDSDMGINHCLRCGPKIEILDLISGSL